MVDPCFPPTRKLLLIAHAIYRSGEPYRLPVNQEAWQSIHHLTLLTRILHSSSNAALSHHTTSLILILVTWQVTRNGELAR